MISHTKPNLRDEQQFIPFVNIKVYTCINDGNISATVPSGRWACIHRVFWASILLGLNPLRGPSTPDSRRPNSVAEPFSPPCPSCPSCWPSCPSCWPSWRQHVPQVLSSCPKNAVLEPTSPNKRFSHLLKHPKLPKNLCFP